jgi:hypothetical protein
LTLFSGPVEIDPQSADAAAGEPRPDDRADSFPFHPEHPEGPYTLTQPPCPGPRHVRLTTEMGDRIPLRADEAIWNGRVFTLHLRPNRELSGVVGVEALYGVTAVFTTIKATQTLTLQLEASDADRLEQAEALVVAVIALNRQRLVDEAGATFVGDGQQERFLFGIGSGYRRGLNENKVTSGLRTAFQTNGMPLSQNAAISTEEPDNRWRLTDGERTYTIRKAENQLNVYQTTDVKGDYSATVAIKSLKLLKGTSPALNQRLLTLQAEIELKAARALREDEGVPIERIRTPGRPVDAERPVDIQIEVEV